MDNMCSSSNCFYHILSEWDLHFVFVFRRKLKADISAAFPSLSADEVSELVPNKQELNVVKIYAHKGDAVTLYVLHKNPLFFEVERRLYPTGGLSTLRWSNWMNTLV